MTKAFSKACIPTAARSSIAFLSLVGGWLPFSAQLKHHFLRGMLALIMYSSGTASLCLTLKSSYQSLHYLFSHKPFPTILASARLCLSCFCLWWMTTDKQTNESKCLSNIYWTDVLWIIIVFITRYYYSLNRIMRQAE